MSVTDNSDRAAFYAFTSTPLFFSPGRQQVTGSLERNAEQAVALARYLEMRAETYTAFTHEVYTVAVSRG